MTRNKLVVSVLILMLLPLVLGASTFFDNPDDFFIMADIVTPGPVVPPVGGGGGAPECREDLDCSLGEFCFENRCYVQECESDADCNDTKTCWMNRCVKLFDMKIIDVQSPINSGEFFEFTYYIKGVAAIHGDVVVTFWLVRDGEVVTEGFDTIYMADFDETTETSELFLPKSVEDGVYNFYIEVAYDSYYARAGRLIEVGEGGILGELLDVSFDLDEILIGSSDELSAGINFDSFGDVPARVNLTFTIIDSFGKEVYRAEDKIIVTTEQFLRWNYDGLDLPNGEYTAILETAYGDDIFDRFTQKFNIGRGPFITGDVIGKIGEALKVNGIAILTIIAILIITLIAYWERKKLKKALMEEEKWLKRHKVSIATATLFAVLFGIVYYLIGRDIIPAVSLKISFVNVSKAILFLLKNYYIYLLMFIAIILIVFIYRKIKLGRRFLDFFESVKKKRDGEGRVKKLEKVRVMRVKALELREIEKDKRKKMLLSVRSRRIRQERFRKNVLRFRKNVLGFGKSFLRGIGEKRRKWDEIMKRREEARKTRLDKMMKRTEEARKTKLEEKREEGRVKELEKVRVMRVKALELREIEKDKQKKMLLSVRSRRIRQERFRKNVLGFFRDVKTRVNSTGTLLSDGVRERRRALEKKIRKYREEGRLRKASIRKRKRKEELARLEIVRVKDLLLKKIKEEKRKRELVQLKKEKKEKKSLRLRKVREKKRGMKLRVAMINRMRGHKKKLAELERVQGNIEKIEKAESSKKSFFGFLKNVKVKKPKIKPLALKPSVEAREKAKSFFGFLKNRFGGQKVDSIIGKNIISKPEVSSVTKDVSVQKPRPEFKPLLPPLEKVKETEPEPKPEPSVFTLALDEKLKSEARLAEAKRKERNRDEENSEKENQEGSSKKSRFY